MPRHVSFTRKHMSDYDRAAQFSPFAALTGYEDCIREAARLTDARGTLDDDEIELLDARLRYIGARIDERPEASVTYFKPDKLKSGGEYITVTVRIADIDLVGGELVTAEGARIPINDVYGIEPAGPEPERAPARRQGRNRSALPRE